MLYSFDSVVATPIGRPLSPPAPWASATLDGTGAQAAPGTARPCTRSSRDDGRAGRSTRLLGRGRRRAAASPPATLAELMTWTRRYADSHDGVPLSGHARAGSPPVPRPTRCRRFPPGQLVGPAADTADGGILVVVTTAGDAAAQPADGRRGHQCGAARRHPLRTRDRAVEPGARTAPPPAARASHSGSWAPPGHPSDRPARPPAGRPRAARESTPAAVGGADGTVVPGGGRPGPTGVRPARCPSSWNAWRASGSSTCVGDGFIRDHRYGRPGRRALGRDGCRRGGWSAWTRRR